jgi:hypothetical protein
MSYDYAIHSDFLIHWTGKDLDSQFDEACGTSPNSVIPRGSDLCDHYLTRVRNILKYGFWLTTEPERKLRCGTQTIVFPSTPMVCFTELKLSESRNHAQRYGRLGIGVKRPYLFQRFGRPLVYYGFGDDVQNDRFLSECASDLRNPDLLNFFKPMNSSDVLTYDFYSESEWRILFMQELLSRRLIIDPRDAGNSAEHAYFKSLSEQEQQKLKFLAPLDGWFALIIYPSLDVKNAAQQERSHQIVEEINRIKTKPD